VPAFSKIQQRQRSFLTDFIAHTSRIFQNISNVAENRFVVAGAIFDVAESAKEIFSAKWLVQENTIDLSEFSGHLPRRTFVNILHNKYSFAPKPQMMQDKRGNSQQIRIA